MGFEIVGELGHGTGIATKPIAEAGGSLPSVGPRSIARDTDLILPQAEALIRAIGADLRIGGDKAHYDVAGDFIRVPPPQAFYEPINWTRTVYHEPVHWAGAAHRLNRDLSGSFSSRKYAEEELVGEVGAAMICASLGVVPTVRHADYLGAWLDLLGSVA